MGSKYFLLSVIFILSAFFTVYGDSPIHYFPFGDLTICKGCGHSNADTWRGKFRLENVSDTDFILYGSYFDGEFSPGGTIQRRNPDICEWQYPNGKDEYSKWSQKSSLEKDEFILKAKQSIEFESHFDESDFNDVMRFTAYYTAQAGLEPRETFSDAFILKSNPVRDENGRLLSYEKPVFAAINNSCSPNCKLSIARSPGIRRIRLGMPLADFKNKFPKARISKIREKNYKIILSWLWDWKEDNYEIDLTFFEDKVVKIETNFKSLKNARDKENFYLIVAGKLGLESFWTPYRSTFECKEFLVDVLDNEDPTITIWDKSFITIRDKMNEEALKKK